ncbi:MAG: primosomal protein N' [Tannerella sp.]|jgi:primosomal protein N' (replication factor Y)|nr:primosomal protein N' [Tannerella sp.]
MKYAEVVIPFPLADTFTYIVPAEMERDIVVFGRVLVPFGPKHSYTGVIVDLYDRSDGDFPYELKEITELLDDKAVVRRLQFDLWRWISSYYICTLGEVYHAAMPAKLLKVKKTKRKVKASVRSEDIDKAGNKVVLTNPQQVAYEQIGKLLKTKPITLLHGVTSSGKTEIYIRLIQDTLDSGRQALYLLPEIAITTQITERLRRVFGDRLSVYHSGYTDNERLAVWNRLIQSDEPVVVLGMRSAVFLPFAQLGLVIVDEEHEPSYKQQDPAPRYHARNVAMMLARLHNAGTLLGSATPSLESYFWAVSGKYGFVKLDRRYGDAQNPDVEIVDVRELRRKNRMKGTFFSHILRERIERALSHGGQVMLFQNRRGFAPFMICDKCGKSPRCVNCDVCLTYHKSANHMVCHYCGYSVPLTAKCPSCGSVEMKMQGFGTEKVEEEAASLFPNVGIVRLDLDTARSRAAYTRILSDFETGKTRILVGTQMITKGLDFADLDVVGIMNADGLMNVPDFRAYERAFQIMAQVSGRAGRRDRRGVVVLQTSQKDNPLLPCVRSFDYAGMAQMQLQERHDFGYPPYTRLIMLILRCRNEKILDDVATKYSEKLMEIFSEGVSSPISPPVTRVQTVFVRKIMLKIKLIMPADEVRSKLDRAKSEMQDYPQFRRIILHYDVDPQ